MPKRPFSLDDYFTFDSAYISAFKRLGLTNGTIAELQLVCMLEKLAAPWEQKPPAKKEIAKQLKAKRAHAIELSKVLRMRPEGLRFDSKVNTSDLLAMLDLVLAENQQHLQENAGYKALQRAPVYLVGRIDDALPDSIRRTRDSNKFVEIVSLCFSAVGIQHSPEHAVRAFTSIEQADHKTIAPKMTPDQVRAVSQAIQGVIEVCLGRVGTKHSNR